MFWFSEFGEGGVCTSFALSQAETNVQDLMQIFVKEYGSGLVLVLCDFLSIISSMTESGFYFTIINFSDTIVKAVNPGVVLVTGWWSRLLGYIIETFLDNPQENMWPQLKFENKKRHCSKHFMYVSFFKYNALRQRLFSTFHDG